MNEQVEPVKRKNPFIKDGVARRAQKGLFGRYECLIEFTDPIIWEWGPPNYCGTWFKVGYDSPAVLHYYKYTTLRYSQIDKAVKWRHWIMCIHILGKTKERPIRKVPFPLLTNLYKDKRRALRMWIRPKYCHKCLQIYVDEMKERGMYDFLLERELQQFEKKFGIRPEIPRKDTK